MCFVLANYCAFKMPIKKLKMWNPRAAGIRNLLKMRNEKVSCKSPQIGLTIGDPRYMWIT